MPNNESGIRCATVSAVYEHSSPVCARSGMQVQVGGPPVAIDEPRSSEVPASDPSATFPDSEAVTQNGGDGHPLSKPHV